MQAEVREHASGPPGHPSPDHGHPRTCSGKACPWLAGAPCGSQSCCIFVNIPGPVRINRAPLGSAAMAAGYTRMPRLASPVGFIG